MRVGLAIACVLCIGLAIVPMAKLGAGIALATTGGHQRLPLPNASTVTLPDSVPAAYLDTSEMLKALNADNRLEGYEVRRAFNSNGLKASDSTMECLKGAAERVQTHDDSIAEIYTQILKELADDAPPLEGNDPIRMTLHGVHASKIDLCILDASSSENLQAILQNK